MAASAKPRYHFRNGVWYVRLGPRNARGIATEIWMRERIGAVDPPNGLGDERQAYRWMEAWLDALLAAADRRAIATGR